MLNACSFLGGTVGVTCGGIVFGTAGFAGVLVRAADRPAGVSAIDAEGGERALLEPAPAHHVRERAPHRGAELESLPVPPGEDVEPGDAGDGSRQRMAVRRPRVQPDPGPAGSRILQSRDSRDEPGGRDHELVPRRRGKLGLAVEGLAPEADGVLVAGPDQEAAPRLAPVPLLGGVIDGAGRRLELRQPVQQSGADRHREHGEVDAGPGGQRSRPCPGREHDGGRRDPLGPGLDPGDASPLGQKPRRPHIDEDTPTPAPDTGEETPDAVRWVGMTALRLPRRGADPLRLQVREELLDGPGLQHLGRDPHRLHQGDVLLERWDQWRRHDDHAIGPTSKWRAVRQTGRDAEFYLSAARLVAQLQVAHDLLR